MCVYADKQKKESNEANVAMSRALNKQPDKYIIIISASGLVMLVLSELSSVRWNECVWLYNVNNNLKANHPTGGVYLISYD